MDAWHIDARHIDARLWAAGRDEPRDPEGGVANGGLGGHMEAMEQSGDEDSRQ
jgi:hypothetical protein